MLPIRIMVVDDFAPFRNFVALTLQKVPTWQAIWEGSDGLEAIEKVKDIKPDLILLDIGLPGLNGIEAARRIRKIAPESKIVFLSLETSTDIVSEAMRSGALGYVAKARAGTDLLKAMEAVLQGRRFVSGSLAADLQLVAD